MGIRDDLGRFRRRSTKETQVNRDLSLLFLKNSPSSTFVVLQKTNRKIDALVVSSYKEGPNELLLFTKNNLSDSAQNVFIGDYITYDNKTYLIFDEFDHPDFADYKKHKMIECNVQFGYDSKKFDAFYMGSRRKLDTLETSQTMRSVSLIGDPNHPLLIASNQPDVKLRKRIMIAGDVWMVDSIDRITIPGIMFLSIHVDVSNTDIDDINANIAFEPEQPEITLDENSFWRSGEIVEVEGLINGFVRFSFDVVIISQTSTSVSFTVPFGISTLLVTTQDNNNVVVLADKEVL